MVKNADAFSFTALPSLALPCSHIVGCVEIKFSGGKIEWGDSCRVGLDDRFGSAVVGQGVQFGQAGLIKQSGNTERVGVTGGNDGHTGECMLLNECANDGGVYGGLIAGDEDEGGDWLDSAYSESDGAAHAALPVLVVHELWM